jgi:hypothetical protein
MSAESWRGKMFSPPSSPSSDMEPTTKVRRRAGIARDPRDAVFAAMAFTPNPHPQPWMEDPQALPKKPPKKR